MLELTVYAGRDSADSIGDMLLAAGALSCTALDADANTEREAPLFGEPGLEPESPVWNNTALSVLFDDGFDWRTALALAEKALGTGPLATSGPKEVPDTDWVRVTQAAFKPIKASSRLWIVPSWAEPPVPGALNIRLDPGVAFGTGSHPTTRLCLEWLDANVKPGDSVMDYGCGTGILAIAASLFGAGTVAGVDLDPLAVDAAAANAEKNSVEASFTLPDGLRKSGQYDIVVANILCNPLISLAPTLTSLVREGGALVLSGILDEQVARLTGAYEAASRSAVKLVPWRSEEGWNVLAAKKAGS